MEKPSFEDKIDVIDRLLTTRKKKWNLTGVSDLDYDDVAQKVRLHIWQKWEQYDPSKPLEQWVNKIISNQIINLLEENYLKLAPPCARCPLNQGGNLCGMTKNGEQNSECPLYKKWEKVKRAGFNIKMAESIHDENSSSGLITSVKEDINWEKVIPNFHRMMRDKLPKKLYKMYDLLYIQNKSDEEFSKIMKFTTNEKNKIPGYKQIYNYKQQIVKIAQKIAKECF